MAMTKVRKIAYRFEKFEDGSKALVYRGYAHEVNLGLLDSAAVRKIGNEIAVGIRNRALGCYAILVFSRELDKQAEFFWEEFSAEQLLGKNWDKAPEARVLRKAYELATALVA